MGSKNAPSVASKGRIKSIQAPANPLKTYGQCQPGSASRARSDLDGLALSGLV